ncbi:MAG: hypothetical protein U5K84_09745 [Alkalibacterium sp.]|nr:hypothetical protein [Alkalibacterium sp.]
MKLLLIGFGAMNKRVAKLAEENGHTIVGAGVTGGRERLPLPSFSNPFHLRIYPRQTV